MRATGLLGAALANHLPLRIHQHTAHARVGAGAQQRGLGLGQRLCQVLLCRVVWRRVGLRHGG